MKAHIPEPVHRVPAEAVASGFSFRTLPKASFEQIRRSCEFYVKKGAGCYSPQSKAARYLYDLANEVTTIVNELETELHDILLKQRDQIGYYSTRFQEFREYFGEEQEFSPKELNMQMQKLKKQNVMLVRLIEKERLRHAQMELEFAKYASEKKLCPTTEKEVNTSSGSDSSTKCFDSSIYNRNNRMTTTTIIEQLQNEIQEKNEEIKQITQQYTHLESFVIPNLQTKYKRKKAEWKRVISDLQSNWLRDVSSVSTPIEFRQMENQLKEKEEERLQLLGKCVFSLNRPAKQTNTELK